MTFRKQVRTGMAAAALVAVTAVATGAGSLTFVSWGGSTQRAQQESWAEPFSEQTGIAVTQAGPTNYGKFKAMVESGNVEWDVVDVEAPFAFRAAAHGLTESIDFDVVDKSTLDPRFVFDNGVGSFYFSFVLGYNTMMLGGDAPSGWDALFNVEKFPGKRALYKWPSPGVLELALLADGVPPDELYPLDVERALAKLDTIKEHIIWWATGAQSQQMLASGEASLGMFWNGRVYTLIKGGAPVKIDWSQNLATADFLVVPEGTPNREAAMRYLARATSPEAQAAFANRTAYAPINDAAVPLLDPEVAPYLPTAHREDQITLNFEYWAEHGEEIAKRWNAWILE